MVSEWLICKMVDYLQKKGYGTLSFLKEFFECCSLRGLKHGLYPNSYTTDVFNGHTIQSQYHFGNNELKRNSKFCSYLNHISARNEETVPHS